MRTSIWGQGSVGEGGGILLYLLPFGWNSNVKFRPPPPSGGYNGHRGSKMVPIEILTPHSYSTFIHTTGLYCTVWPQYTTQ